MSRVYEALKRAERQRLAETPALAATVWPSPSNRSQPQPESITTERAQPKQAILAPPRPNRHESPIVLSPHPGVRAGGEVSPSLHTSDVGSGPLLVVGHDKHVAAAEQFHLLSLSLQNWSAENDKSLFTITSALSQDGKSFVSLNLAATIAMSGNNHVILVDADLRQPALHRSFNLTPRLGLIDYLNGEAEFGACLHATTLPHLQLIPAGGTSDAPAELLAGARMREFLREGRSLMPRHYIIIDSPAASLVPEARILSRLADALLLVVAANRTPREAVKQTIDLIGESTVLGVVLNRFEPPYSALGHYRDKYTLAAALS
jgi:protein-tyrosine kinase